VRLFILITLPGTVLRLEDARRLNLLKSIATAHQGWYFYLVGRNLTPHPENSFREGF
jgi:hypothetical protein